ncbi:MAG: hypothetical protein NVSMB27_41080 [Ktedonobacteraceae bacterium]
MVNWDRAWWMRYKIAMVLCPVLFFSGKGLDRLFLRKGFSLNEFILFAVGATAFFLSDTGWWTVSVKSRMEYQFAICGIVMVSTVALLIVVGVGRTTGSVGWILCVAFTGSWLVSEYKFRNGGVAVR